MLAASLSLLMNSPLASPEALWREIEPKFTAERAGFWRETSGKPQIAFNWSLGVAVSAEVALARFNSGRIPRLKAVLEMTEAYWNAKGPVAGYDVLPGPRFPNDRYYDDNAWMVMAMVEAFEVTKDRRWLRRAEAALRYVLSGEDQVLGGGIYWREIDKPSKNTCSNAPAVAAALAVHRHTRRTSLILTAERLYAWTRKHLRDPADGLYWDHLRLDGSIEKTKWSYNSALMLRSARELARITRKSNYSQDAASLERAAIRKWIREDGGLDDELPFAHLLFENLDPARFDVGQAVQSLMAGRRPDGTFGLRWGDPKKEDEPKLLFQASAIRALAVAEGWRRSGRWRP